MSGHIDLGLRKDSERQRRYNEMLQKINNNSAIPSTSGSICDSRFGAYVTNSTVQPSNSTLPPSQFYTNSTLQPSNSTLLPSQFHKQASNQMSNQFEPDKFQNPPSNPPSVYAQSDTSVFKMPHTTRQYSVWAYYKNRLDFMMSQLQMVGDKARFKFLLRLMENAIHIVHYQQFPAATNPTALLEYILNTVKDKYYSGIPMSISGAGSVMSEQPTEFDFCPRVVLNDINNPPTLITQRCNEQVSLPPPVFRLPPQSPKPSKKGRISSKQSDVTNQEMSQSNRNLEDSGSILFTESHIAQIRDENIACLSTALNIKDSVAGTRQEKNLKPSNNLRVNQSLNNKRVKKAERLSEQESIVNPINKENFESSKGMNTTSRTGRPIKKPVKFWKGNESKFNDTDLNRSRQVALQSTEPDLNESMTLRNNKVLDKKKTLLTKNNSNIPNGKNNVQPCVTNKCSNNKSQSLENKENLNIVVQKKTTNKNKTSKSNKITPAAKEKNTVNKSSSAQKKRRKPLKSVSSKADVKPEKKRKSEAFENELPKRKKAKECIDVQPTDAAETSFDDDLFGDGNDIKFSNKPTLQALSPTSGIQSAKKAVGIHMSKETPPCKTLGMLMNASSHSAASSVVKDVPPSKVTKVVKRVTKVLENEKKSRNKSSPNKTYKKKENESKKNPRGILRSNTPLTTVMTAFELERDEESEYDADDDDLE